MGREAEATKHFERHKRTIRLQTAKLFGSPHRGTAGTARSFFGVNVLDQNVEFLPGFAWDAANKVYVMNGERPLETQSLGAAPVFHSNREQVPRIG